MDPVRLRKTFGKDLLLWGGIDKRKLARDKKDIDEELLYKLPSLLDEGGYIPTVDHTVPSDVSWENWQYYVELKRKIIEGKYGA
jgi:uroporphyrinogen decarboxylase